MSQLVSIISIRPHTTILHEGEGAMKIKELVIGSLILVLSMAVLPGCTQTKSGVNSNPPSPTVVGVSIAPTAVSIQTGTEATFTAIVTGSPNTAVTWSVREPSGCGSITPAGVYTAPASATTCHVVATSVADPTKFAQATVTVTSSGSGTVNRPGYNTGNGFFTYNGKIYDANGVEFKPMGMNAAHQDQAWAYASLTSDGIANSGANIMRVFQWYLDTDPNHYTWMNLLKNLHVVSIITCANPPAGGTSGSTDPSVINSCVNSFIAAKSLIDPYARYTMINIANEWGDGGTSVSFRDTYVTAVQNLRAAGFSETLVIDGGQGQAIQPIELYGQYIYDHDPQHNIIFSYHDYGSTPSQAQNFMNRLVAARTASSASHFGAFPVILGEFGPYNTWGGTTPALQEIAIANTANVGWMAWAYDDASCAGACFAIQQPPHDQDGNFPQLITSGAATGQPTNCTNPGACTASPCNCTFDSDLTQWGNYVIFNLSNPYQSNQPTGLFYVKPAKATVF